MCDSVNNRRFLAENLCQSTIKVRNNKLMKRQLRLHPITVINLYATSLQSTNNTKDLFTKAIITLKTFNKLFLKQFIRFI